MINQTLVGQSTSGTCDNAIDIPISDNGFGKDSFISKIVDLTDAGKEFGEFFPEGFDYLALDHKTVWFKFKIETTRSISIELRQRDSAISQNAVGMAIYKGPDCLPRGERLEPRLVPINKFGEVSTNCLAEGEYLIQVCGSHKANDSIWLEVHVGNPPLLYDFQETAQELGKFNGEKTFNIQTECLSLENSAELYKDLPSEYNKTAWFTLETNSDIQQVSITIENYNFLVQGNVYVLVYEGDIRNGFANLNMFIDTIKFFALNNNNAINNHHFLCEFEENKRYSIVFYFKNSSQSTARFRLNMLHAIDDNSTYPPTLSQVFDLGKIATNNSARRPGIFTCSSRLSNHLCDSVNRDTVTLSRTAYQYFDDTIIEYLIYDKFDLASWRVFELTDSGRLSIILSVTNCDGSFVLGLGGLRIFKGDVRTNCELPIEASSRNGNYTSCFGPGVYSVQFLGKSKREHFYYNYCYQSDVGEKFRYQMIFNPLVKQPDSKYSNPENPENLGNISNVLNTGQPVGVTKDYFNLNEENDTLKIPFCMNRIYREFYIDNPTVIRQTEVNYQIQRNGSNILYKGRFSEGQNLDSLNLTHRRISNQLTWGNACDPLDTGWFTIVSCAGIDCNNGNFVHYSDYQLRQLNFCTDPKNKVPSKALSLNPGGNDFLIKSATPYSPTVPDYAKLYQAGDNCVDCEGDSLFGKKLNELCKPSTHFHPVPHYYYFKLEKKSDVYVNQYWHLLYNDDLRFDSLKMLDTDNLIQICDVNQTPSDPAYYCGLEPGFYTLVMFTYHNSGLSASVWFDEHLVPKYDHAETAYDFSEIIQNQAFVSSPLDVVSCMTGSHPEHGIIRDGLQVYQARAIPNYPLDSFKLQHNRYTRRNLWYTFTARGTGEIEINLQQFTRPNASLAINLYESSSDPNIPYNQLKDSNQLDSNETLGLKFLSGAKVNIKYNKGTCELKRYIVQVIVNIETYYQTVTDYEPLVKKWAIVSVKMTGSTVTPPGDYCTNAPEFIVNNTGNNQSQPYIVNCHTTGEGYGEDGSNLACLDPGVPFKTTWVKIRVTRQGKNDLTFSVIPNLGSLQNNNQIRFRVLYGDCNAMTPGPCLAYFGSSFRLDCMPPGDYYLQVSTPAEVGGNFRVRVNVSPALYPECKPAPLFEPFANFNFKPPCDDSVVTFNNWSTAGDDMVYQWNFGNGQISNEKNPTVAFSTVNQIDTFIIKLIVTNTRHNSHDSISKTLRIRKEPLDFKIVALADSFCAGFVELKVQANFVPSGKINWTPPPDEIDDSTLSAKYYVFGKIDLKIKAEAYFGECYLIDSNEFFAQEINSFKMDSIICVGDTISFDISDKLNEFEISSFKWYDGSKVQIKNFYDTGTFWLQLENGQCEWVDTFNISHPSISDDITPTDTFACFGTVIELGIDSKAHNPLWSTGEQSHKISVNQSGSYHVTAFMGHCELNDIFSVKIPVFENAIGLSDTTKCINESIWIYTQLPTNFHEWSDGSSDTVFEVSNAGQYYIKVGERHCDSIFYFNVSNYPSTLKLTEDTTACEEVVITLDAGIGQDFRWVPTEETTQSILVKTFGNYSVNKINLFGCEEEDSFSMVQYCGPKLFIPNAFSPNGDGLNDEFLPYNENLISFTMQIYNRWGELIYNSSYTNKGWNGFFGGKMCQQGVYMYVIHYSLEDEGKIIEGVTKGTLNLLR